MNLLFWALMLVLLLVALVIIILPLLRVRSTDAEATVAYRDSNLGLYRDKLRELESDLAEGRIDHDDFRSARAEVDRELLHDIPEESRETAALHYGLKVQRRPGLALVISVFLPMFALLTYMQLGMHAQSEQQARAQGQSQGQSQAQAPDSQAGVPSIADMTTRLAERLEEQGGSVQEWAMLGRAYKHLGQYPQAARAFAEAIKLQPDSVQLMLEQAEVIALGNNQRFNEPARNLVIRAAELEPDNLNVLWFAGVAEIQTGRLREGIAYLGKLAREPSLDEEVMNSIRIFMTRARDELVAQGEEVPELAELIPERESLQADADTAGFNVNVSVDETVRDKFQPADVVFVYARAKQGPPMPLAVQRMTLADLPSSVRLDDSMAMMEGMNLSAFGSVIVSARVTKSGSAMAQAGDYIGDAVVEDVTKAESIDIQIERVVE